MDEDEDDWGPDPDGSLAYIPLAGTPARGRTARGVRLALSS
jgi:hypothetical protein